MAYRYDDLSDGVASDQNYWEPPLPDNSNGSPDMQSSTPGNGFGNWIVGNLGKVVDYAIARDSQNMQMKTYDPRRGMAVAGRPATGDILGDRQLMFIGLGVLVFLIVRK